MSPLLCSYLQDQLSQDDEMMGEGWDQSYRASKSLGDCPDQECPPGFVGNRPPPTAGTWVQMWPLVAAEARAPPWFQGASVAAHIRVFLTTLKYPILPLFIVPASFLSSLPFLHHLLSRSK